jgi:hypothetical protein
MERDGERDFQNYDTRLGLEVRVRVPVRVNQGCVHSYIIYYNIIYIIHYTHTLRLRLNGLAGRP